MALHPNRPALLGKNGLAALLAAALVLGFSAAQSHAATLADTIQEALASHPRILASLETEQAARQQIKMQQAGFMPVVSVNSEVGRETTNGGSPNPNGRTNTTEWKLTQSIFDGANNLHTLKAARLQRDQAEAVIRNDREAIALRAAEAYLNILQKRKILRLAGENLSQHEKVHEKVQLRARRGGGDAADVYHAVSRLMRSKARVRQVAGELRNAETDFLEAVGHLPAEKLEAATVLSQKIPETLEKALDRALAQNPSLRAAEENSKVKDADVVSARSRFFPTLDLEITHTNEYHSDIANPDYDETTAMLVVKYDLFRGNRDISRWRQARHQRTEAQRQEDAQRRLVIEQVRVDFENYQKATEKRPIVIRRAQANRAVVKAYRQQFELMRRTLLDLLDSQEEHYQAMVEVEEESFLIRLNEYRILSSFGQLAGALSTE